MPLVAAVACPHTPQLLIRPETEDRELVLRVHAAYAKVKQLLTAAQPDVICVIAGDHVEGFFLNAVPAFAVYAAPQTLRGDHAPLRPRAAALIKPRRLRGVDADVQV